MLSANQVWFGYTTEKPVLRGVSLAAPRAAIVGILGPNGSGKTTLLRLLAGTRQPQQGSVTLDDAPLASLSRPALARRMAVVPQETQLAFDYSVAEVAMMGRYAHLGPFQIEGPKDVAVIDETLAATGTLHLKDRLFATLSGGEKQRVIIATALAQIFREEGPSRPEDPSLSGPSRLEDPSVSGPSRLEDPSVSGPSRLKAGPSRLKAGATYRSNPGYLLLDEPTASLDLGYQLEVADLLLRLRDERGIAIVISTHDLALAGALCERVLLLRDGAALAEGRTAEVLTRENVRALYGVEVDVLNHASGRRILVPLGRSTGR